MRSVKDEKCWCHAVLFWKAIMRAVKCTKSVANLSTRQNPNDIDLCRAKILLLASCIRDTVLRELK